MPDSKSELEALDQETLKETSLLATMTQDSIDLKQSLSSITESETEATATTADQALQDELDNAIHELKFNQLKIDQELKTQQSLKLRSSQTRPKRNALLKTVNALKRQRAVLHKNGNNVLEYLEKADILYKTEYERNKLIMKRYNHPKISVQVSIENYAPTIEELRTKKNQLIDQKSKLNSSVKTKKNGVVDGLKQAGAKLEYEITSITDQSEQMVQTIQAKKEQLQKLKEIADAAGQVVKTKDEIINEDIVDLEAVLKKLDKQERLDRGEVVQDSEPDLTKSIDTFPEVDSVTNHLF